MGGTERTATVERKTRETEIRVALGLDGSGEYEVSTGIPFLDHMLESFAKHGAFDLRLQAKGDLEVDLHHTVEDVGIALGQAFREAVGGAEGIRRYGFFVLPMAEAKVEVAVDLSNRPYLVYRVELTNDRIGTFDASLTEDFVYAFSQNAGLDLHIENPNRLLFVVENEVMAGHLVNGDDLGRLPQKNQRHRQPMGCCHVASSLRTNTGRAPDSDAPSAAELRRILLNSRPCLT